MGFSFSFPFYFQIHFMFDFNSIIEFSFRFIYTFLPLSVFLQQQLMIIELCWFDLSWIGCEHFTIFKLSISLNKANCQTFLASSCYCYPSFCVFLAPSESISDPRSLHQGSMIASSESISEPSMIASSELCFVNLLLLLLLL